MTRLTAWSLLAVLVISASARGQSETKLDVEIGWGGHVRAHRWIPIFVTASDRRTRNVSLEVHWPHGGSYAMRIEQTFAIGPAATTFPLVLPTHSNYGVQEAVFTLHDADSGKTLASFPPQPGSLPGSMGAYLGPEGSVVGVSGMPTNLESLQGIGNSQQLAIDYMNPAMLSTTALGYDSLDLLALNQPNLSTTGGNRAIDATRQQAMLDWVRAGGSLLLWPSAVMAFPDSSPIVDMLPCRLGQPHPIGFAEGELAEAGLPARFAGMVVFDATPDASARTIDLLAGKVKGYGRRLGLGQIIVVPVDISSLTFADNTKADAFWRPLLAGTRLLTEVPKISSTPQAYQPAESVRDEQIETQAAMKIADQLGDVPGAGRFGIGYVVLVLAGMMVVVGPVDWFVLKKLGRQPWTWVTTSGWILLITFGAVSLGYFLKSGDLHYRTLRMIDQADGATVATVDNVGIYSPRTRQYALSAEPDGWWQPAAVQDFNRSDMGIDVGFHQTYEGNTPTPLKINVWSLRFLRGDRVLSGPAAIAATLTREHSPERIVGVIKNLTDRPLTDIHLRAHGLIGKGTFTQEVPSATNTTAATTQESGAVVADIPPFATVRIGANLEPETAKSPPAEQMPLYTRYPAQFDDSGEELWQTAAKLDMRRARRIDELLKSSDDLVCLYATVVEPAAMVTLNSDKSTNPIPKHWQFIRALVEVHK